MALHSQGTGAEGTAVSPGGFEFGVTGWHWSDPMPKSITFFTNGTAMVSDQYGRPIRGSVRDDPDTGRRVEVMFATAPPRQDMPEAVRGKLGTHAQVVAALQADGYDWRKLVSAGWPQLPYADLKKLAQLPVWSFSERHTEAPCNCVRCCIRDPKLRADALRARAEAAGQQEADAGRDPGQVPVPSRTPARDIDH